MSPFWVLYSVRSTCVYPPANTTQSRFPWLQSEPQSRHMDFSQAPPPLDIIPVMPALTFQTHYHKPAVSTEILARFWRELLNPQIWGDLSTTLCRVLLPGSLACLVFFIMCGCAVSLHVSSVMLKGALSQWRLTAPFWPGVPCAHSYQ